MTLQPTMNEIPVPWEKLEEIREIGKPFEAAFRARGVRPLEDPRLVVRRKSAGLAVGFVLALGIWATLQFTEWSGPRPADRTPHPGSRIVTAVPRGALETEKPRWIRTADGGIRRVGPL